MSDEKEETPVPVVSEPPKLLPVEDPNYWGYRLRHAKERSDIHKTDLTHVSVWDMPVDQWHHVNQVTKRVLAHVFTDHLEAGRVLDAGCGYGELINHLPPFVFHYCGVDLSPDLIAEARLQHPNHIFHVANLRSLPFPDNSFDIAICRSVEGVVVGNLGQGAWDEMEKELLRVAKCVLLLGYEAPEVYRIVRRI